MQKTQYFILFAVFSISVILVGCTSQPAPATPVSTPAATSTQEILPADILVPQPTETVAPTLIPTPTPEPIPCTISFDTNRDGDYEVYRMAPDGSDLINLTQNDGDDFDPSWSPDGKQVAFVSNRAEGEEGGQFIYLMNADGSNVRQLSLENESKWPDWSPDGKWITYTYKGDIFIIKADGSGSSINLTNSPEEDGQSVWSPDSSQIAWLSGSEGNSTIFLMNADGSDVRQITDHGKVYDVTWTVDGQLFTHWENQTAGCFNCVMNPDGSNVVDAGGKGEIRRYLPFWTLEGYRVELISADVLTGDNEILLVGEIFPDIFFNLTTHPADDRNPDWPANCGPAPDGEMTPSQNSNGVGEIVIGYAGDDPNQPERKAIFQKACDELGIRCIYGEIPELIALGADAVVQNSNAIAVDGLFASVTEAKEKQIPVFILDAESNIDGAYSITIDHRAWAQTSLAWMLEKAGGEGEIAYFDLHPFNRYADAIDELLSKYPNVSVVEQRDGKYDSSKIKPETVDFMNNHPGLKAVWTSFKMGEGLRGLAESGVPQDKWPLINCEATRDGLETWMRIQADHPNFDCIAVVNPPGIAYDAVYAAYYLASGFQLDESALGGVYGKSLYVDIPVITRENLQEWLDIAASQNMGSLDAWMTPAAIKEKWFKE